MRVKADLLLLLATVLWGSAFVVMRIAAGHGSIFLLNGARFLLGGVLLIPFVHYRSDYSLAGFAYVCMAAIALFSAVAFQQAGLATTTAGNAGFITSLSVVFVPIILLFGWREWPSPWILVSLVLAVLGAFLLSAGAVNRLQVGDIYVLIGSFFWAAHIVIIAKGQVMVKPIPFACGQFLVCGILGVLVGLFFEAPMLDNLYSIIPAVVYTGIFSIAIGFTLQVKAQEHVPPTDAALILSLEGVFAAVFGWVFLTEKLGLVQIAGCVLIILAVLLAQVRPGMVKLKRSYSRNNQ